MNTEVNEVNHTTKYNTWRKVVIVIVLLVIGFVAGILWMQFRYPIIQESQFTKLNSAYTRILTSYLNGAEKSELINGATVGMVSSLKDPYSQYLVEKSGEEYTQSYEGEIYGIGAEIRTENDRFYINSVYKDTPAEKAGLQANDEIITVDGELVEGLSTQELLSKVRGEEGKSVSLGINRIGENSTIEFTMKRAAIPIYTVHSESLENGIGLITISRFAEKTGSEFKEALEQLQASGQLNGLIIDMRSNPGGLLSSTLEIANLLVPKDKMILDVVYKDESKKMSFASNQKQPFEIPIVVLVNENSASASEVLAAALKESAGAEVVGKTTYGKGVVQTFGQFDDQSVLVLTEAQWKTPNGSSIHNIGVEPTYEIDLPPYANLRPISSGTKLQEGNYGDEVQILQSMLNALGYVTSEKGLFDKSTTQALHKFQQSTGLTSTGIYTDEVGAMLITQLRALLEKNDQQLEKAIELLK